MSDKHTLIGQTCSYEDGGKTVEARIVEVKAGSIVLDSAVGKLRTTQCLRLEPLLGGARFWIPPVLCDDGQPLNGGCCND